MTTEDLTPETLAEWRKDAESDLRGMVSAFGARSCRQILALLDPHGVAGTRRVGSDEPLVASH